MNVGQKPFSAIGPNCNNSTYITDNYYDKSYINNLPSGGGSSSIIECEVLKFKDYGNTPAQPPDTLVIKGGDHITIKDGVDNVLMDLEDVLVQVKTDFKVTGNSTFIGDCIISNH